MMVWKGHNASPGKDEVKPSPDFKTLNKMAVARCERDSRGWGGGFGIA